MHVLPLPLSPWLHQRRGALSRARCSQQMDMLGHEPRDMQPHAFLRVEVLPMLESVEGISHGKATGRAIRAALDALPGDARQCEPGTSRHARVPSERRFHPMPKYTKKRGLSRMALPNAAFLGKTGRYRREASLCRGTLSSEAIGHQALRGGTVAPVHTCTPQFHRAVPFRKRHSGLSPFSHVILPYFLP